MIRAGTMPLCSRDQTRRLAAGLLGGGALFWLSGACALEAHAFLPQGTPASPSFQMAQMSGADLVVRLQQMENQLRGMNGRIEQLEIQNRRLDEQLKRFQGDVEFRFQEQQGGKPAARPRRTEAPVAGPVIGDANPVGSAQSGDGGMNPSAPPANLGRLAVPEAPMAGNPGMGAGTDPGLSGSEPGSPLVLSPPGLASPSTTATLPQGGGRAPAVPVTAPPNQTVASAPSSSGRDEFDLGVGFIQRKDYELAEITLRRFLQEHPDDRLANDAQYWLGESLYQRGQYNPAADAFLKVVRDAPASSRAPDSMLRLGMSLSGLGEKDAACATYAELSRKYPRASGGVKAQLDREMKRVKC